MQKNCLVIVLEADANLARQWILAIRPLADRIETRVAASFNEQLAAVEENEKRGVICIVADRALMGSRPSPNSAAFQLYQAGAEVIALIEGTPHGETLQNGDVAVLRRGASFSELRGAVEKALDAITA